MAENKKRAVSKSKTARSKVVDVASKIPDVFSGMNSKVKQFIHSSYVAKRPLAIAKVTEIRNSEPQATPKRVQEMLDMELIKIENKKGGMSVAYSSEALLYVLSSMEIRNNNPENSESLKAFTSLMVVLDARGVRVSRQVLSLVMLVLPFLKGPKAVKAAAVAAQSLGPAKRALQSARTNMVPVLKEKIKGASFSSFVIDQTASQLGPIPSSWPSGVATGKSTARKSMPKNN